MGGFVFGGLGGGKVHSKSSTGKESHECMRHADRCLSTPAGRGLRKSKVSPFEGYPSEVEEAAAMAPQTCYPVRALLYTTAWMF